MSRFRITIRGEGTELRGYATIEAMAALTAPPGEQPYMVMASPAEDDYDPFRAHGDGLALRKQLASPPPGWYTLGTHVGQPDLLLEFWGEDGGIPIWERPIEEGS